MARRYVSGWCGAGGHKRCVQDYGTAVCTCGCHDEPPRETR